jgi:putative transposase
MKKLRYSDSQILAVIKQVESGVPIPELCREHGVSGALFYKWRVKYGGMDAPLMARMKELEGKNQRLKKNAHAERYNRAVRYDWLNHHFV